jgi:hypothetical protein
MNWLRTIRGLVPLLTGVFVVAQFAGVVPFRVAHASPVVAHHVNSVHVHGEHLHKHADSTHDNCPGHEHGSAELPGAPGTECCALHGLAAIVPVVVVAVPIGTIGERIADCQTDKVTGVGTGRLERPPKFLLSL